MNVFQVEPTKDYVLHNLKQIDPESTARVNASVSINLFKYAQEETMKRVMKKRGEEDVTLEMLRTITLQDFDKAFERLKNWLEQLASVPERAY